MSYKLFISLALLLLASSTLTQAVQSKWQVSRYYNFLKDSAEAHQVIDFSAQLGNKTPYHTWMGGSQYSTSGADTMEVLPFAGRLMTYRQWFTMGDLKIQNPKENWAVSGTATLNGFGGYYFKGHGTGADRDRQFELYGRRGKDQHLVLLHRNMHIGKTNTPNIVEHGQFELWFGPKVIWSMKNSCPHTHKRHANWGIGVRRDPNNANRQRITLQMNGKVVYDAWQTQKQVWSHPSTSLFGARQPWNWHVIPNWQFEVMDFVFHRNWTGYNLTCKEGQSRHVFQGRLECSNMSQYHRGSESVNNGHIDVSNRPGTCRRRYRMFKGSCISCGPHVQQCKADGTITQCDERTYPIYNKAFTKTEKCQPCPGTWDTVTRECHKLVAAEKNSRKVNHHVYDYFFKNPKPASRVIFETQVTVHKSVDQEDNGIHLFQPYHIFPIRNPPRRMWHENWNEKKPKWTAASVLLNDVYPVNTNFQLAYHYLLDEGNDNEFFTTQNWRAGFVYSDAPCTVNFMGPTKPVCLLKGLELVDAKNKPPKLVNWFDFEMDLNFQHWIHNFAKNGRDTFMGDAWNYTDRAQNFYDHRFNGRLMSYRNFFWIRNFNRGLMQGESFALTGTVQLFAGSFIHGKQVNNLENFLFRIAPAHTFELKHINVNKGAVIGGQYQLQHNKKIVWTHNMTLKPATGTDVAYVVAVTPLHNKHDRVEIYLNGIYKKLVLPAINWTQYKRLHYGAGHGLDGHRNETWMINFRDLALIRHTRGLKIEKNIVWDERKEILIQCPVGQVVNRTTNKCLPYLPTGAQMNKGKAEMCRRGHYIKDGKCVHCIGGGNGRCDKNGQLAACGTFFQPIYKDNKILKCEACNATQVWDPISGMCYSAKKPNYWKKHSNQLYDAKFDWGTPQMRIVSKWNITPIRTVDYEAFSLHSVQPINRELFSSRRPVVPFWPVNQKRFFFNSMTNATPSKMTQYHLRWYLDQTPQDEDFHSDNALAGPIPLHRGSYYWKATQSGLIALKCEKGYKRVNGKCIIVCPPGQFVVNEVTCAKTSCTMQQNWNAKTKKCVQIKCPTPKKVHNGSSKYAIINRKCVLQKTCPKHFALDKKNAFLCKRVSCPKVALANGKVTFKIVDHGCVKKMLCNTGFVLENNSVCKKLVCPKGLHVQGSNCVKVVCPKPTNIPNGKKVMAVQNGKCTKPVYQCNEGFKKDPKAEKCDKVVCIATHKVVGNGCKKIECPKKVPVIANGKGSYQIVNKECKLKVVCNPGLVATAKNTCECPKVKAQPKNGSISTKFEKGKCVNSAVKCNQSFVLSADKKNCECPKTRNIKNGKFIVFFKEATCQNRVECAATFVRRGNACACPAKKIIEHGVVDQKEVSGKCVPKITCAQSFVEMNGACACPKEQKVKNGAIEFNFHLQTKTCTKNIICDGGFHNKNGVCTKVVCKKGEKYYKGKCVSADSIKPVDPPKTKEDTKTPSKDNKTEKSNSGENSGKGGKTTTTETEMITKIITKVSYTCKPKFQMINRLCVFEAGHDNLLDDLMTIMGQKKNSKGEYSQKQLDDAMGTVANFPALSKAQQQTIEKLKFPLNDAKKRCLEEHKDVGCKHYSPLGYHSNCPEGWKDKGVACEKNGTMNNKEVYLWVPGDE